MSSVADSWNHSAAPLSVCTNDSASQLSPRRDTSTLETVEEKGRPSKSKTSCFALKERDYIGLWNSSSPSVQGLTVGTSVSSATTGSEATDLQPKDAELGLELGLSLVPRRRDARANSGRHCLPAEANAECIVASINCPSEQAFIVEQRQVATSHTNSRKLESDHYIPAHDGIGRVNGVSENVPLPVSSSAARTYGSQSSPSDWNRDHHFLSQRGCLSHQAKCYSIAECTPCNSNQNDLRRQDVPHHLMNGQALAAKTSMGGSELRVATSDVSPSADTRPPYDASSAQKFWQIHMSRPVEGYRPLPSKNANVTEVALAPGRFAVPVPKVGTVPAKRPFFDSIPDRKGTNFVRDNPNDPRGNAAVSGAPSLCGPSSAALGTTPVDGEMKYGTSHTLKVHTASGFFPWTNVVQLSSGWQPVPAHFKAPTPANVPSHEPVSEAKALDKVGKVDSQNDDIGSRAAVVGWPPIRSFRKNTLAAHAKQNDDDLDVTGEASTTHYVKAKLDGAKVQRKVDLNSCSSHESLKLALQDLFEGFINGSNAGESEKFDLVHGSDFVIAYEDFDGDLMLARDVPWEDFVTKVKRLRVMKASEAKVGSAKSGSDVNA